MSAYTEVNAELNPDDSPFHAGEQAIQTRLGVRDNLERFGRKVIRDHMPEQHREFFNQLPYVFVGYADDHGWPWASLLIGDPGFMVSDTPTSLRINTKAVAGDGLESFLENAATDQRSMGLLGIELETRRRNRLSAHVTSVANGSIALDVDQAFGNCPQYIQTRRMITHSEADSNESGSAVPAREDFTELDQDALALIQRSDTFFVSSYVATKAKQSSSGVDVSHRGGRPGFVRTDDANTLTVPDYLGNFHFNTIGNFLENPKAGLLFIDFDSGDILSLTGTAEILWDDPDAIHFNGAERLWRFSIDHGFRLKQALSVEWEFGENSANTDLTGTWKEADDNKQRADNRNDWATYKFDKIVQESSVINSFYLKPENGHIPEFHAGQFLTVRADTGSGMVTRTYTVSSAPADKHYRISVKHERSADSAIPDGEFSSYLHQQVIVGDIVELKAPTGSFTYDAAISRPALFMGGGVGITPLVSMARHASSEGLRTRYIRPLTLICAVRSDEERPFFDELNELCLNSAGVIRVFWVLSNPEPHLKPGVDFHQRGHVSKELLQAILPVDDYDAYLCGPKGFMQFSYDMLRSLGVNDERIYAESFGPASLQRDNDDSVAESSPVDAADQAVVFFTESKVEQSWSAGDGSLLEFAENHGLTPEYGCRSGKCGACKVTISSGQVSYTEAVSTDLLDNEILLCCAVPAKVAGGEDELVSLSINL